MRDDNTPPALPASQLFILLALAAGSLHAYGIRSRVRRDSQGAMRLDTTTLKAAARRLEQCGWIERDEEAGRVRYILTSTGQVMLAWELDWLAEAVRIGQERLRFYD